MEESKLEVHQGDLLMYRARPALVTAIRPNPKTATPHARLAFLDGASSKEFCCSLLPRCCWQNISASQLTPSQQQRLNLLSGTLPEGALLPGIPQFLLETLEHGEQLDLHLHLATTAELARQVSALTAEMLCRRRIASILVLCQPHRLQLWERALATYFGKRFLCLSAAAQPHAAYPFLLAAYQLQPQRLAELSSDQHRFLVLDQPTPEFAHAIPASHQLTLGLLGNQPQPYTPLRQMPTPSPLYYLPSSGEVQVTRAFNLFCWAFTEQLAHESPANSKHGHSLMSALAEQLQASPAVFKQSWLQLRQGLAENQWAGSAEVEAAWQVVHRMKHWDDREHHRATLVVFKRMGAWLLPMAEPIQHELDSLHEALHHWNAQQDGRFLALRRFIESQKESQQILMVVSRFAEAVHELTWQQWPVSPQLQPPELPASGFTWFLCTDTQLAEFEDVTPHQLIHWDLPEDLATLINRRKSETPEFFLQNSKKPNEGHARLFEALTAAVWPDQTFYRQQLHKSLMDTSTS